VQNGYRGERGMKSEDTVPLLNKVKNLIPKALQYIGVFDLSMARVIFEI